MSEATLSDQFFVEDVLEEVFATDTKEAEYFTDNNTQIVKRIIEVRRKICWITVPNLKKIWFRIL